MFELSELNRAPGGENTARGSTRFKKMRGEKRVYVAFLRAALLFAQENELQYNGVTQERMDAARGGGADGADR